LPEKKAKLTHSYSADIHRLFPIGDEPIALCEIPQGICPQITQINIDEKIGVNLRNLRIKLLLKIRR
jgi:hypothetical protein